MKVFVSGGTGAIGRFAVPGLVAAGHDVTVLARSDEKAARIEAAGAAPVRTSLLGVAAVVVGMWAAVAPRSFYADFPGLGRVWVGVDGPFNEHLARDVGQLFLAMAVVTWVAAARPVDVLVRAVAAGWLVQGLPHFVYHASHLGLYETPDAVLNMVSLGVAVLAAAVALVLGGERPAPVGQTVASRTRHRALSFAAVLAVACAAAGLIVGVALAMVVARVPEPRPIARGPRAAVTILTGLAFLAAALRFGATGELPIYLFVFAGLVTVSAIDLRFRRLPDVIVIPTFVGTVAGMAVIAVVRGDREPLVLALLGALLYFLLLFVPHLISPRGMGFGDVKLGAVLGLAVGWLAPDVLATITLVFSAGILGMVLGLVLGLLYRAGWKGTFPLGPALALGAAIVILSSDSLVVR